MSITSKGTSRSIQKKDLTSQKNLALGFQNLAFHHKASAGQTGINLYALTMPAELTALGYTQGSISDLASANLLFFQNNIQIISSARGILQPGLSYLIASSSQINFNGFTALEGEIFSGYVNPMPKTGLNVVDASPIIATGTITAGLTDFNVGAAFEVNKYPSSQIGSVMVILDGIVQMRNSGNSSATLDGNYYEVLAGGGLGNIIRFNQVDLTSDRSCMVISNGLLAERPDGSMMGVIEAVNGKLNNMATYVAALAGQSTTTVLGAAPTNVDLKSFSDQVVRKAFLDVTQNWTATQNLLGRTNGIAVPANIIGETVAATFTTQTVQATINVELDITGATLALGVGQWMVFYDSLVTVNNGLTAGNSAGRVRMTDTSNNAITISTTLFQATNVIASGSVYQNVTKSFPLTVTSAQTYKLRWTGDRAPGAGASQADIIFRGGLDVGAFSGIANMAQFFAVRIA